MHLSKQTSLILWTIIAFLAQTQSTPAQETQDLEELSMSQLELLGDLREAGAIIDNSLGVWTATLNDGNEIYIPRAHGSYDKETQPTWSGTPEQIRLIADLPIHTVHVMRKKFSDEDLAAVTSLSQTRKLILHLEHADVSPEALKRIAAMDGLVELFVQSPAVNEEFLEQVSSLENLEMLGFSGCHLSASGIRQLQRLPQLSKLNIGWTSLSEEALAEIAQLDQLKELKLNKLELSGIAPPKLDGLASLESVSLMHSTISDDWIEELSKLRDLNSLNFYGTAITDEQFKTLLPALVSSDEAGDQNISLYLDRTSLTDASIELILNSESLRYSNAFVVLPSTVSETATRSLFEANPNWRIVHYQMIGGRLVPSHVK